MKLNEVCIMASDMIWYGPLGYREAFLLLVFFDETIVLGMEMGKEERDFLYLLVKVGWMLGNWSFASNCRGVEQTMFIFLSKRNDLEMICLFSLHVIVGVEHIYVYTSCAGRGSMSRFLLRTANYDTAFDCGLFCEDCSRALPNNIKKKRRIRKTTLKQYIEVESTWWKEYSVRYFILKCVMCGVSNPFKLPTRRACTTDRRNRTKK